MTGDGNYPSQDVLLRHPAIWLAKSIPLHQKVISFLKNDGLYDTMRYQAAILQNTQHNFTTLDLLMANRLDFDQVSMVDKGVHADAMRLEAQGFTTL